MRGVTRMAVVLAALALCAAAGPPEVVVEGTRAQMGQPTQTVRTAGEIVPVRSIMVRNEVAGIIAKLGFKDGDVVAAGDLLVQFDDRRYATVVAEQTAAAQLAELDYNRVRQIDKSGFGKKADTDDALATMQQTAAQLERARLDLAQTTIRAPFAGVLGIRRVHAGQYLAAQSDIVNLDDVSSVMVHFRLPQRYLGQVAPGHAIAVTAGQTGARAFAATIGAIDPELAADSRTLRVQGVVANDEGVLRPGQFVTVSMELTAGPPRVFVPEAAVVYNGEQRFVVKVVDGKAQPAKVTTGQHFNGLIAITDGVAAEDTVIVAGQEKVFRGGVPVKVLPPSFLTASGSPDARIVPAGKP